MESRSERETVRRALVRSGYFCNIVQSVATVPLPSEARESGSAKGLAPSRYLQ